PRPPRARGRRASPLAAEPEAGFAECMSPSRGIRPARTQTQVAQAEAIRQLRGATAIASDGAASSSTAYAGLVTRSIAFALDALIVNGAAALVGVIVGLGLSILHLPADADKVIAAVLAGLWVLW